MDLRWNLPRAVRVALVASVVAFAVAAALGRPALAQSSEALDKITQLNREALAAVDKREFEKARELLRRALDLCQEAGMDKHPLTARTHVHMGAVIIEGFKNRELGIKQFAKALEIEPSIAITKTISTPELEEAFAEAKALGSGAGGGAPAGGGDDNAQARAATAAGAPSDEHPSEAPRARREGGASVPSAGLSYHTVSEVRQGSSVVITVSVEESLKFSKIILAYRPPGVAEFLGRVMEPVGDGAYSAEIPANATTGASVAYYIEAQNDDGQPVAARGSEERPLVISFAASARGGGAVRGSGGDHEAGGSTTVAKRRGEGEEEEEGPQFYASLLVGSGVGYTTGNGEVNADTPVSGTVSGALLGHIAPEFGYWLRPDLMLSLQGRIQLVTGPTEVNAGGRIYGPVKAAYAAFARATWLMGDGPVRAGELRPFFAAGLGAGQIRHVVTFSNLKDCGLTQNQTCVDSVVAGPFLVQGGAGVMYKLASTFSLVGAANAELAAPKFTANLDVNLGVAFDF